MINITPCPILIEILMIYWDNDTFTVIYCQTIYHKKISNTQQRAEIVQELASVRAFCHENQENHRNRSTYKSLFLTRFLYFKTCYLNQSDLWVQSPGLEKDELMNFLTKCRWKNSKPVNVPMKHFQSHSQAIFVNNRFWFCPKESATSYQYFLQIIWLFVNSETSYLAPFQF